MVLYTIFKYSILGVFHFIFLIKVMPSFEFPWSSYMVISSLINPAISFASKSISSLDARIMIPLHIESSFSNNEHSSKPKYLKYPLISAGITTTSCPNNRFNLNLL